MPFHLLVVEDSAADTRLIQLGLARCDDCTADFTEAADVALALLRREAPYQGATRPDLILLDTSLPGIGSHQLLTMLMEDSDLASIPVVVFRAQKIPKFTRSPWPAGHERSS